MAIIGLSIESNAMHAVLFDSEAGTVLASEDSSSNGSDSLSAMMRSMRAAAADLQVQVEATAFAYRTEHERAFFSSELDKHGVGQIEMVPAQTAFLGWLAEAPEFQSAECVLLYHVGSAGVAISLADTANKTLSAPRNASLESKSPEHLGGTVPLAWEILDEAGMKPDAVALFGDGSADRNLPDILSLGLSARVIRVEAPDRLAAEGAARVAALAVAHDAPVAASVATEVHAAEVYTVALPAPAAASSTVKSVVPPLSTVPVAAAQSSPRVPRKKIVLTAALLVGILSGGVALASTLPGDAPAGAESADAALVGATHDVEASQDLGATETSAAIPEPVAGVPLPPPPGPEPVPDGAPAPEPSAAQGVAGWPTIAPTTTNPRSEILTPIPVQAIPPAAAVVPQKTVEPPQFTVPVVIPEQGKSQEQLEQEAWDRHWQHTADWLEQELGAN
ncbi:MAG: hypothetical protein ACSLE8_25405 [Rhodococcus sp. (in: high G+C Gram-positive bacteria)]